MTNASHPFKLSETKPGRYHYLALAVFLSAFLRANEIIPPALPALQVFILCLALIFIPGASLLAVLHAGRKPRDPFREIPYCFCLGLSHFTAWGVPIYLIRGGWVPFQNLLLASALGLFIAGFIRQKRAGGVPPRHKQKDKPYMLILLSGALLLSALAFYFSGAVAVKAGAQETLGESGLPHISVGLRTADKFNHWTAIKKLTDGDTVRNQWPKFHYSYNIWHLYNALSARFTGTSYRLTWALLIFCCLPVSALAVSGLGTALFRDRRAGLACAFIYLVNGSLFNNYFSDAGLWNWIGASNPREVGHIFMAVAFTCFIDYLRGKNKVSFWLAVLTALSTLFIHDMDFLFILTAFFLYGCLVLLFNRQGAGAETAAAGKVLLLALLLSLPLLKIKLSANKWEKPSRPAPVKATHRLRPAVPAPAPAQTREEKQQLGLPPTPIIFLAFLLITSLFPYLAKERGAIFIVANTALIPLIAYNSLFPALFAELFALLGIKAGSVTISSVTGLRSAVLIPAVYICAYCAYKGFNRPAGRKPPALAIACAGGAFLALLSSRQFNPNLQKYLPHGVSWPFYPPWAIFLLSLLNLSLLLSEKKYRFPGKLLAGSNGNRFHPPSKNAAPHGGLAPVALLSLTAITLALPAQLAFFRDPVRYQSVKEAVSGPRGFAFVESKLPDDARILADPATSLYLSAYTGKEALSFYALERAPRTHPLLKALNSTIPAEQRLQMLKKHRIEYIYLNKKVFEGGLSRELERHPERYKEIYRNEDTEIYYINYSEKGITNKAGSG